MVRPFTLRDLALVRRLSEQGVSLHAESALADNLHPLRGALLGMVTRQDCPTLIWKSENRDRAGFIQLLLEEDRHHAHILFLSPPAGTGNGTPPEVNGSGELIEDNTAVWLSLLDQAVAESGRYGIHSLVAEVDENGPELPILRQAGFAVYARQDIWVLDEDTPLAVDHEATRRLRPRLEKDDWDIQLLYANTVPRLVQLVEPLPPAAIGKCWVQRDEANELTAFVQIHEGTVATWLRFYIHPSAEHEAEEILQAALAVKSDRPTLPVYCCVRRYEGWLPTVIERAGFRLWGSQAVMVKHTVQHIQRPLSKTAVAMENAGMPVSTPYAPHGGETKRPETVRVMAGGKAPADQDLTQIVIPSN
jgi:hypothetical protein